MKKIATVLAALVLCLLSTAAFAGPKQGGYEAGLSLNAWFFGDDVDSMAGPSANFLAYYTDTVSFGGRAELGLGNDSIFCLLGEVQFNLPDMGEVKPYAGVLVGPAFASTDSDSDTFLKLGGLVGVKSYIDKDMAIFGEFQMGALAGNNGTTYMGLGVGALFKL